MPHSTNLLLLRPAGPVRAGATAAAGGVVVAVGGRSPKPKPNALGCRRSGSSRPPQSSPPALAPPLPLSPAMPGATKHTTGEAAAALPPARPWPLSLLLLARRRALGLPGSAVGTVSAFAVAADAMAAVARWGGARGFDTAVAGRPRSGTGTSSAPPPVTTGSTQDHVGIEGGGVAPAAVTAVVVVVSRPRPRRLAGITGDSGSGDERSCDYSCDVAAAAGWGRG